MKEFTILISDRNRHVREYLRREMAAEGYKVQLAKNTREVLKLVYHDENIDLIILDPELPYGDDKSLLEKIRDRIPNLPVVIHSFFPDDNNRSDIWNSVHFVEKDGSSIEHLKKVVSKVLMGSNPR